MPYLSFLAIFCLLAYYLAIKLMLLKHYSLPDPVGGSLAEDTTDYFLSLFVLMYSVGCVLFEYLLYTY